MRERLNKNQSSGIMSKKSPLKNVAVDQSQNEKPQSKKQRNAKQQKRIDGKIVVTFDIETDPFKFGRTLVPFCTGWFDGEVFNYRWGSDCIDYFIDIAKDNNWLVYAHNGGKFDYYFFGNHLANKKIMLINSRIAKFVIGESEFRDSLMILPQSLKSYKKDDIDIWKLEREHREAHKPEIISYLKGDCVYLHEWINGFHSSFGRPLTVATAAMNELKKSGYPLLNNPPHHDEHFRKYYHGGRVSIFQGGYTEGVLEYLDINSAYPYAMMFEHPHGVVYDYFKTLPDKPPYFATITAISNGALPHRTDNKLTFPNDNIPRKYNVTGWEIQAGLDTGTLDIITIHEVWQPINTENFKTHVDKWYTKKLASKLAGDNLQEILAKLIMNSSYGKFGIDPTRFKEHFLLSMDGEVKLPDGQWRQVGEVSEELELWEQDAPSDRFYDVAVAASITGFVRAYLWRAICNSVEPVYCDTDSLICRRFNGERGNALGAWKDEGAIAHAYIAGRKMYALELVEPDKRGSLHKVASKGVRVDFETIKSMVMDGLTFTYQRDAPAFSMRFGARYIERKVKATY